MFTPKEIRTTQLVKNLVCILGGFLILSCVQSPPAKNFVDLSFSHLPLIHLNVNSISINRNFLSIKKSPYIEHLFPIEPVEAAEQWVKDRLRAKGGLDRLVVSITRGTATEKRQTHKRGILFNKHSIHYASEIEVKLQILDPRGEIKASVVSHATQDLTSTDNLTISEREMIWFQMTESMMLDLNRSLEKQINQYFFIWIK